MKVSIRPGRLSGTIRAIESKSYAHRALICAAFADRPTEIVCTALSDDIEATIGCLRALGAEITRDGDKLWVTPVGDIPKDAILDCKESGSTYRFILPCVCMRGADSRFRLGGRLPVRPMDVFWNLVEHRGITVQGKGNEIVCVKGKLTGDKFKIPGNVSSQYISGLAMALGMSGRRGVIEITNGIESLGYINITLDIMEKFGIKTEFDNNKLIVHGEKRYRSSGYLKIEGDWSNAAFWLCSAAAQGSELTCTGLNIRSKQGDRAVCDILEGFGAKLVYSDDSVTVKASTERLNGITIDAHDTPDLIPAVAVCAVSAIGETVVTGAARLRLKESDRLETVTDTLNKLGGKARVTEDGMVITGTKLSGGETDGCNDHRIVMMSAAASSLCTNEVTITGAQACEKSYPTFFDDFRLLGGNADIM
ncbi:MAG: 3-phosphoshikimate 1-carboxyvinyltransferase [Clostridia bacterium]|nr:3-phosphoshikimate 1-carboxyvinyltransferase [Clostridia bacterium]